jgi:hypothetical protein
MLLRALCAGQDGEDGPEGPSVTPDESSAKPAGAISSASTPGKTGLGAAAAQIAAMLVSPNGRDAGAPGDSGVTGSAVSAVTVTSLGTLAAAGIPEKPKPEKSKVERLENAAGAKPAFDLALTPAAAQSDAGHETLGATTGDPHSARDLAATPAAPDPLTAGISAPPGGPKGTSALAFAARLIDRTASTGLAATAAAKDGSSPAAHDAAPSSLDGVALKTIDENLRTRKPEPDADPAGAAAPAKVPAERSPAVLENAPAPRAPLPAAPDAAGRVDHTEIAAGILRGGNAAVPAARNDAPPAGAAAADPRDISVRLSVDNKPSVDVRITDRAGEVHVAVRSADPEMAAQVRSGLSELTERLHQRGFDAEIWRPPGPASTRTENTGQQESREGSGSGRGTPEDRGHQPRDGQRQNQPPAWVEDIESSFATTLKGTGA